MLFTRRRVGKECWAAEVCSVVTVVVEFARAKRRSVNLRSGVDENRVTLMDDPRLSNYFALTEASGKNRYGSSLKVSGMARGVS